MNWVGLAGFVASTSALVILAVIGWEFIVAGRTRPSCARCGGALTAPSDPCALCASVDEWPAPAIGDATAALSPNTSRPATTPHDRAPMFGPRAREPTPQGGHLNRGVTRRMVRFATWSMVGGLAVRGFGMLDGIGIPVGLSNGVMIVLTLFGGAAAFIGFVVLDLA